MCWHTSPTAVTHHPDNTVKEELLFPAHPWSLENQAEEI